MFSILRVLPNLFNNEETRTSIYNVQTKGTKYMSMVKCIIDRTVRSANFIHTSRIFRGPSLLQLLSEKKHEKLNFDFDPHYNVYKKEFIAGRRQELILTEITRVFP